MLHVKTPEEVLALIGQEFSPLADRTETVPLTAAMGRVQVPVVRKLTVGVTITDIRLVSKTGGVHGDYFREEEK